MKSSNLAHQNLQTLPCRFFWETSRTKKWFYKFVSRSVLFVLNYFIFCFFYLLSRLLVFVGSKNLNFIRL